MSNLSTADRVLLIELYFSHGQSVEETRRKFAAARKLKRRTDAPSRPTILALVHKFRSTGSVADLPRTGRQRVSPERIAQVSSAVATSSGRISTRRLTAETGVPHSTLLNILHQHLHLYPYRAHCIHRLLSTDKASRITFCQRMLAKTRDDESFLANILWTDEANFHLNGAVNTWNFRVWSAQNPNEMEEQQPWSPKITVWLGFTASFILPPFFFEENGHSVTVTSERYCQMLQQHAIPHLKQKRAFSRVIYQQDGATPHTAVTTKTLLRNLFDDNRVISRGFDLLWPSHSPDLNGCDFWLWGYLKANVYHPTPETCEQLKERIISTVANIPRSMLTSTVNSVIPRLQLCIERSGAHMFPEYK